MDESRIHAGNSAKSVTWIGAEYTALKALFDNLPNGKVGVMVKGASINLMDFLPSGKD